MNAQLACHGRLGRDPELRTSQSSGNPWASASIAVDLGKDSGEATMWFAVVAFSKAAEVLAKHVKGDLIAVSGRLQLNRWRDGEGKEHERLQVVADSIVSAKTVRPGGGRKRGGSDA